MILQQTRLGRIIGSSRAKTSNAAVLPLEAFVEKRDYIGALTLLNFSSSERSNIDHLLWKGYCSFHNGALDKAQEYYIDLLSINSDDVPKDVNLYLGCVYFYMRMYTEAIDIAQKGPECSLKHRLMYHIWEKTGDEQKLKAYRQQLKDSIHKEDLLSHAAMLYAKRNFQDATDIYKRFLVDDKDSVAINLYVAMCYFKMDYYDVSLETLSVYDQGNPDSITAKNLRACNNFRLHNGSVALEELKEVQDLEKILMSNDLLRHNMVVFTDGQKALQVLPPLVEFIPEARLNLAIYHMRNDEVEDADELLKDEQPTTAQEYILKAVINATIGQTHGNKESMRVAQSCFKTIGTSPSDADTIPGRQCMASSFFLQKQFEDANVYLSSIENYMSDDDDFNWNYGISLAASGGFKQAEEVMYRIKDPSYKKDPSYNSWLARCLIMNEKPEDAWKIYLSAISFGKDVSSQLLQVIANDCFRLGYFLVAAKAFSALRAVDDDDEGALKGILGSCVGVFRRAVIASKEQGKFSFSEYEKNLAEVINILTQNKGSADAKEVISGISQWAMKCGAVL